MLFKDIIGQNEMKQRLIQTVKDNRVSHAQLFLGQPGTGTLALAIAYAQYINCKNKTNNDACGVCPSCVKYSKLAHPDLHFIFPVATTKKIKTKPKSEDFNAEWRELAIESDCYFNLSDWYRKIGIENKQGIINAYDCNEIIKKLSYTSYESEYKVMIVFMVEKLYYAAAPKLLKILEEPPDKTLFLLISENQDQIINTILSRTQIVKIPKLIDQDIKKALIEKENLGESEALNFAFLAGGDFLEAKKYAANAEEIKVNFNLFVDWVRICWKYNYMEMSSFVSKISKIGREKQKSFLSFALRMSRNSILKNYHLDKLVKLDEKEKIFMKKFYPFINPENGQEIYNELNKAYYHIERNANSSILFMDLSLKTARLIKSE